MLAHRSHSLAGAAMVVTNSGVSPVLYVLVALAAIRGTPLGRRWWLVLVAVAVVAAGMGSRLLLSQVFQRPRPPLQDRLVTVHGFSYPSGHAAMGALVAGALIVLLTSTMRSGTGRVAITIALVTWATLVALSRLYLGVHWLTDVRRQLVVSRRLAARPARNGGEVDGSRPDPELSELVLTARVRAGQLRREDAHASHDVIQNRSNVPAVTRRRELPLVLTHAVHDPACHLKGTLDLAR
jgi:hypothetical protein